MTHNSRLLAPQKKDKEKDKDKEREKEKVNGSNITPKERVAGTVSRRHGDLTSEQRGDDESLSIGSSRWSRCGESVSMWDEILVMEEGNVEEKEGSADWDTDAGAGAGAYVSGRSLAQGVATATAREHWVNISACDNTTLNSLLPLFTSETAKCRGASGSEIGQWGRIHLGSGSAPTTPTRVGTGSDQPSSTKVSTAEERGDRSGRLMPSLFDLGVSIIDPIRGFLGSKKLIFDEAGRELCVGGQNGNIESSSLVVDCLLNRSDDVGGMNSDENVCRKDFGNGQVMGDAEPKRKDNLSFGLSERKIVSSPAVILNTTVKRSNLKISKVKVRQSSSIWRTVKALHKAGGKSSNGNENGDEGQWDRGYEDTSDDENESDDEDDIDQAEIGMGIEAEVIEEPANTPTSWQKKKYNILSTIDKDAITTEEELNWVENEGEGVKQTHDYVINEDIESVRSEGPLVVFKERWKHKERRVRRSSAAGHLRSVII